MQAPPTARDILVLSQIVDLVRETDGATRSWIEAETGLGRAVVNDRLAEGIELGILEELEPVAEKGRRGRPSRSLRFRAEAGVVLSACLGASSMHAAVSDLDGEPIVKVYRDLDVSDGPEATLRAVHKTFQRMLAKAGEVGSVWGIAIGVPGPVEFRTGRVVAPRSCLAGTGSTCAPGSTSATARPSGSTTRSTSWPSASGREASRRSGATCST